MRNTFTKAERLCSQSAIDWLFDGHGSAFTVWPLRVVWKVKPASTEVAGPVDAAAEGDRSAGEPRKAPVLPQLLISVPKKRFHHAVDRNRVKRLIREAYRKNSGTLASCAAWNGVALTMAVVYVGDEIVSAAQVEQRVNAAIQRISNQITREKAENTDGVRDSLD